MPAVSSRFLPSSISVRGTAGQSILAPAARSFQLSWKFQKSMNTRVR